METKRTKVMTVVGTRPEIIRLSRVIAALEDAVDHTLVHTGQNYDYELNEIFFKELGVRQPDHFLNANAETPAKTIGAVIANIDPILEQEAPDAFLILGDTNSCLCAYAAKRRKVPVFHMEAGNRCFDQRVPEEINRRIVDHISDINMPYSEHSRRYLLREGIRPETVIKTGSPMNEVLTHYMPGIENSDALERLGLKRGEYFVISCHREENVDSERNFSDFIGTLNAIAEKYGKPIIVSAHPRTRKRIEAGGTNVKLDPLVRLLKPLGFFDYVKLQKNSFCVLSDSGTIMEESSILNFPAVMIRQAHERPEGMDEGVLIMSGLSPAHVMEAIDSVTKESSGLDRRFRLVPDYDADNVSAKVVRIILSHVEYVNRTVWFK